MKCIPTILRKCSTNLSATSMPRFFSSSAILGRKSCQKSSERNSAITLQSQTFLASIARGLKQRCIASVTGKVPVTSPRRIAKNRQYQEMLALQITKRYQRKKKFQSQKKNALSEGTGKTACARAKNLVGEAPHCCSGCLHGSGGGVRLARVHTPAA